MSENQEEVFRKVRTMVRSLLEGGAEPSDVSFALSFIATELGLEVAEGSIAVFPVVMAGICHAVANAADESVEAEDTDEQYVPNDMTVH